MNYYLYLPMILFIVGTFGIVFSKKNIILIIMCLELLLLAANFNFIIFSVYLDDIIGVLFSLIILTLGAAESAIGLALLICYNNTNTLQ